MYPSVNQAIIGLDNSLFGVDSLFEPLLAYCSMRTWEPTNFGEIWIQIRRFLYEKMDLKVSSA